MNKDELDAEEYVGVISALKEQFGFITCPHLKQDAYFNFKTVQSPVHELRVTQKVRFRTFLPPAGRFQDVEQATDVIIMDLFPAKVRGSYKYRDGYIQGAQIIHEEDMKNEFKSLGMSRIKLERILLLCDKYLVAFLNSSGGTIYFGVQDNGVIDGIALDRDARDTVNQKIAHMFFRLKIDPSIAKIEFKKVYSPRRVVIANIFVVQVTVPQGPPPRVYQDKRNNTWMRYAACVMRMPSQVMIDRVIEHKFSLITDEFKGLSLSPSVSHVSVPDAPAPDVHVPDVSAPDAQVLDVPAPDAPAPDVPAPDVPAPDVYASDAPSPDVPDIGVPAHSPNSKDDFVTSDHSLETKDDYVVVEFSDFDGKERPKSDVYPDKRKNTASWEYFQGGWIEYDQETCQQIEHSFNTDEHLVILSSQAFKGPVVYGVNLKTMLQVNTRTGVTTPIRRKEDLQTSEQSTNSESIKPELVASAPENASSDDLTFKLSDGREVQVLLGDITKCRPEGHSNFAIVNAANDALIHGGGVCGAIFDAAGPKLPKACANTLQIFSGEGNHFLQVGDAVSTLSYDLGADGSGPKYIIHGIAPNVGQGEDIKYLFTTYKNCLSLLEGKITAVVFPSMGTGIYGCDIDLSARIFAVSLQTYFGVVKDSSIQKVVMILFSHSVDKARSDMLAYVREINDKLNPQTVSTGSESEDKSEAPAIRPQWQWRDMDGWQIYDDAIQDQLEQAHLALQNAGNTNIVRLAFPNGVSYAIDVKQREQINEQTDFKREIRRSLLTFERDVRPSEIDDSSPKKGAWGWDHS